MDLTSLDPARDESSGFIFREPSGVDLLLKGKVAACQSRIEGGLNWLESPKG